MKKRLIHYSASAAALMTISNDLHAQILYEDIDPDGYVEVDDWPYSNFYLDMTGDGSDDLWIAGRSYYFSTAEVSDTYFIQAIPLGSNEVAVNFDEWIYCYSTYWCWTVGERLAPKLFAGDTISPLLDFTELDVYLGVERYGSGVLGFWGTDTNYLAVKLMIADEPHYGYVHMYTYNPAWSSGYAIVYDYAYSTTPNTPIIAGDTMNCVLPELTGNITTPGAFKLFFGESDGTNQYKVRYREAGTDIWSLASNDTSHVLVDGLDCSTTYEYKYKVACGMDDIVKGTGWSSVATITTDDCRISYLTDIKASIYPNPATGQFNIHTTNENYPESVRIMESNGQLVREFIHPGTFQYETSGLSSGLYIIQIQTGGTTINELLLIEK